MKINAYLTAVLMQAQKEFTTLKDWLRFMVSQFNLQQIYYGHGTDNAFDEAVYLLLHTLNLPLDQLEPYLDAKLLPVEIDKLCVIIQKRVYDRMPAAYLTNEAHLFGYSFYVDQRVIIPRSFIAEILLNNMLEPWSVDTVKNILDLCTGNGSLAVIAADCLVNSQVIASDISQDALDVALINVKKYHKERQINLIESDLFNKLPATQFDLIISNPPYVATALMQTLPQEYSYEPSLALAGGNTGLEFIKTIIANAAAHLTNNGILLVEMGANCEELAGLYPQLNFHWFTDLSSADACVFLLTKNQLLAAGTIY